MKNVAKLLLDSLNCLKMDNIYKNSIFVEKDKLIIKSKSIELKSFNSITIIGLGKASFDQVDYLYKHLHKSDLKLPLREGLVITKHGHANRSNNFKTVEASHPLCDESSLSAGKDLIKFLKNLESTTLLLFCLSGGASALAISPIKEFSLQEKQEIFVQLLKGGTNINETNLIRKIISEIKNGGFAIHSNAKAIITLAISDVPSDDFSIIASAPTTFKDEDGQIIEKVIQRQIKGKIKDKLIKYIHSKKRTELLKENGLKFKKTDVTNLLISDYHTYCEKFKKSIPQNISSHIEPIPLDMSFSDGIMLHLQIIKENITKKNFLYLSGGELPVIVTGNGLGGRNSQFVVKMGEELFKKNILNLTEAQLKKISIY